MLLCRQRRWRLRLRVDDDDLSVRVDLDTLNVQAREFYGFDGPHEIALAEAFHITTSRDQSARTQGTLDFIIQAANLADALADLFGRHIASGHFQIDQNGTQMADAFAQAPDD